MPPSGISLRHGGAETVVKVELDYETAGLRDAFRRAFG
jgi:hypothetical protein